MDESSFYYYQMSYNGFGSSDFPKDDNGNNSADKEPIFDSFSEFFGIDEWLDHEDEQASSVVSGSTSNTIVFHASEVDDSGGNSNISLKHEVNKSSTDSRGGSQKRKEVRDKVAFKTKSDVEILNDGFKWRKYGKKKVKNSPNPRNYYKCSVDGCLVKKRVERDRDDPGYVITTYEGVHNHESPNF